MKPTFNQRYLERLAKQAQQKTVGSSGREASSRAPSSSLQRNGQEPSQTDCERTSSHELPGVDAPQPANAAIAASAQLLLPPSTRDAAWWRVLVLSEDDVAVSLQDALLAFAHVSYRLGYASNRIEHVMETPTVGRLHEILEELYGQPGWRALTTCWEEAAGILQPQRPSVSPPHKEHGKPCLQKVGAPAPALDQSSLPPGSWEGIPQPRVPVHRWESAEARAQRERLANLGGWPGG
jgi:hypothetical protein